MSVDRGEFQLVVSTYPAAFRLAEIVPERMVCLSGAISGDPDFRQKFARVAWAVRLAGSRLCFNPGELPGGWDYETYMEVCLVMVRRCDVLLQLPGWSGSPGARAEVALAESLGKVVAQVRCSPANSLEG